MEELEHLDRRQTPRVGIAAEILVGGDASWAGTYHTADLSTSGAFLVSDEPPPRGAMLLIDLKVDGEVVAVDVRALVVHTRAAASDASARGCGLMFLSLGADQSAALHRLVGESVVSEAAR